RLWELATGLGDPANRDYVAKLAVAFLVTAMVGLPVRLAGWELPETVTPIAWALVLGGVWMLVAEHYAGKRGDVPTISWKVAVLVGLAQVVAGVFPGTSRSAAAIFMAMLAGTSRRASAAEFVFLVGIPTMFAASAYAFLELAMEGGLGGEAWGDVLLAFAAAAVTGFAVVRWLMGYIKAHPFTGFAVYRITFGLGLLLLMPARSQLATQDRATSCHARRHAMSAVPRTLLPLLLAAMLEGCASPGVSSALPAGEVATLLAAHHWRLDEATDRRGRAIDALMARPGQPLQLDFGDGRLAVSNTRNRMSAPWRIEADALQLGPLASTMMACTDPALASLDREVATRLRRRLQLALDAGPRPRLVLTTAGGRSDERRAGDECRARGGQA